MKSFMSFRKVAFGLLLGTLPLAGSSLKLPLISILAAGLRAHFQE